MAIVQLALKEAVAVQFLVLLTLRRLLLPMLRLLLPLVMLKGIKKKQDERWRK